MINKRFYYRCSSTGTSTLVTGIPGGWYISSVTSNLLAPPWAAVSLHSLTVDDPSHKVSPVSFANPSEEGGLL